MFAFSRLENFISDLKYEEKTSIFDFKKQWLKPEDTALFNKIILRYIHKAEIDVAGEIIICAKYDNQPRTYRNIILLTEFHEPQQLKREIVDAYYSFQMLKGTMIRSDTANNFNPHPDFLRFIREVNDYGISKQLLYFRLRENNSPSLGKRTNFHIHLR